VPETWIGRPPSASSEHPSVWTGEQEAPLVPAVQRVGEEQRIADCTAIAAVLGVMLDTTHTLRVIIYKICPLQIIVKSYLTQSSF
jgi:cobalamin biosynthesis protein CobD/CbiB